MADAPIWRHPTGTRRSRLLLASIHEWRCGSIIRSGRSNTSTSSGALPISSTVIVAIQAIEQVRHIGIDERIRKMIREATTHL